MTKKQPPLTAQQLQTYMDALNTNRSPGDKYTTHTDPNTGRTIVIPPDSIASAAKWSVIQTQIMQQCQAVQIRNNFHRIPHIQKRRPRNPLPDLDTMSTIANYSGSDEDPDDEHTSSKQRNTPQNANAAPYAALAFTTRITAMYSTPAPTQSSAPSSTPSHASAPVLVEKPASSHEPSSSLVPRAVALSRRTKPFSAPSSPAELHQQTVMHAAPLVAAESTYDATINSLTSSSFASEVATTSDPVAVQHAGLSLVPRAVTLRPKPKYTTPAQPAFHGLVSFASSSSAAAQGTKRSHASLSPPSHHQRPIPGHRDDDNKQKTKRRHLAVGEEGYEYWDEKQEGGGGGEGAEKGVGGVRVVEPIEVDEDGGKGGKEFADALGGL
ncbi:hypothetical protein HK097_005159 [Rhizophlyctis rosea]|uniref:Uncharacterized protein n=1 Tax=Rhizophlyctis rosea TaxID=64517 RepID=A0AAD5X3B1_9FUNG|nr:hypothetical protein HK097_005159 [Rhizophlyctis rosea]